MPEEFVKIVNQPLPIGEETQISCVMLPNIRLTIGKFTLPNKGHVAALGIRSPEAQEVACFDEARLTAYIEELQKVLDDMKFHNKARVN